MLIRCAFFSLVILASEPFVESVPTSSCPASKVLEENSVSVHGSKKSGEWVTTVLPNFRTANATQRPNLDVSHKVIRCDKKEIHQVMVVSRECSKLKIVSRSKWGAKALTSPQESLPTADCVIVDGSSYNTSTRVGSWIKGNQEFQTKTFGGFLNNFYIGDNGEIYEALGWDKMNIFKSGGLRCLRIAFVKSTIDVTPSIAAVDAFNKLLKLAICIGKLSQSYRVIPYYFIDDYYGLDITSFERSDLLKWDRCEKNTGLRKEEYGYKSLQMIFKEEWGGRDPVRRVYNRTTQTKLVMVGDFSYRCFTTKACIHDLKSRQQKYQKEKMDFPSNYIIGDDGFAYEVFSWSQTWNVLWVRKEMILIEFLGRFHSYLPSERAMKTFQQILKIGEEWGFLSPDYKIVSMRQIDNDPSRVGEMLDTTLRKMERFYPGFKLT